MTTNTHTSSLKRTTAARVVLPAILMSGMALSLGGCVRRTVTITTEPSGALVMMNDREVGRTPVEVEFLWYGNYDLRLSLDGHEPLSTHGKIRAPIWDTIPMDLVAEVSPGRHEVRRVLHYELVPSVVDDDALVERALQMRSATLVRPVDAEPEQDG